jgi:Zn-dependent protease with chaperone function
MFELLGISLLLACLLTFNSLASLVTDLLWRLAGGLTNKWSAQSRARLLFLLRTLPGLLAIFVVAFLLVPAYLAHEPRRTNESVSFKLGVLAFLSAIGIGSAVFRSIAAWRATRKLTEDWLLNAERITIDGVEIATYRIEHAFPVIAIVGAFRPRLFIASQILELLSKDEIAAALVHENGHLIARDNLKRGLMRASRDALLIIPNGRLLDKAWAAAAEEAADENAAQKGGNVALDLASALVKVARNIPQGTRPTMPAGVFLVGDDDEAKGIKARVRRLLEFAATDRRPAGKRSFFANPLFWSLATLLLISTSFLFYSHAILLNVHAMIEHAVQLLD